MKLFEPVSYTVDLSTGAMLDASGRYEKRLSDLHGLYGDTEAFTKALRNDADQVMYDVTEFRPSSAAGDLIFGVTRMNPGRIGNEFFLTRGHIHENADRPEIYYGQKGHGVMLLESPAGETRTVEIGPQTICYVPPYWIHRSINVGAEDLVMMFTYPADSGQDYGIIERAGGMRHRVVADGESGWALVENTNYRFRPENVVATLFTQAA